MIHDDPPVRTKAREDAPSAEVSEWSGSEREQAVQRMFTAIARCYDLNNSLLSFGLHHYWKRQAVASIPLLSHASALDLGAGTGDLARLLANRIGGTNRIVAADLNEAMLREGMRKGSEGTSITWLRTNAERLGFRDASLDVVTAGFCIRNVGDIPRAFAEIQRVLRPGGRFICLEFSRPVHAWIRALYDWYSFRLLPWIGTSVARDPTGVYHYLPASIRTFPDQEGLKAALLDTGFQEVRYRNLTGGIVAIHVAIK